MFVFILILRNRAGNIIKSITCAVGHFAAYVERFSNTLWLDHDVVKSRVKSRVGQVHILTIYKERTYIQF